MRRAVGKGLAGLIGIAAAWGGCSTAPPPISTHNLERPSDLTFGCVGLFTPDGADAPQVSGRPMSECHAPLQFDLPPDVTRRTFGFVANTARNELSVIDMDASLLVDLDPANPETNVAPLGVLPEQISASDDGCRIVSANRGSCDLTLVNVSTLMSPTLMKEGKITTPAAPRTTVSQDIVVRGGTTGNRLMVAPFEVAFLPQDTSTVMGTQKACAEVPTALPVYWTPDPSGAKPQWKALVSYPTCSLVALVDLPSGNIVDSVKINVGADGQSINVVSTGSDPDCPVHDFCDDPAGSGAGADAGTGADAGAAAPAANPFVNPNGTQPGPLAILPDGQRAYVGLGQASFIAAIDIQQDKLVVPPFSSITLHEGALGADRIRLSVDPYKPTGQPGVFGRFVGEGLDRKRQYLYVMARDGTVRVIDVSLSTRDLPETECDTNVDPVYARSHGDPATTCWPTEPPDFAHRRPFAQGPGIRLPSIPRDVAFADLKLGDDREAVLDGVFGFILTSSGSVYIVNIDPTLRKETLVSGTIAPSPLPEQQPLVNSLRDHNILTFTSSLDPSVGPPRVDLAPVPPPQGPLIEGVTTTSAQDNATDTVCAADGTCTPVTTYVFFPERSAVNRQTWSVTWEGDYFGPSFSGQFSAVPDPASPNAILKDVGIDFCQQGAVPGDTATIFGCTVDQQCGPLQVCRRSDTAAESAGSLPINGLCVPLDPTLQAQKIITCAPLLETVRRYEILEATGGGLTNALIIRPKIDEVVTASLAGCIPPSTTDADAGADAGASEDGGRTDASTLVSCAPVGDPTRANFKCVEVDPGAAPRCVQPCDPNGNDCRSGRVCVTFGPGKSFCADGPALSTLVIDGAATRNLVQACGLDQLTAYKLGVGGGFLVQGTAPTPYVPPQVSASAGCELNPLLMNRIPYVQTVNGARVRLPLCDPALGLDVYRGFTPDEAQAQFLNIVHTTPVPDPCLIQSYDRARDNAGNLVKDANGNFVHVTFGAPFYALFQNRELRFLLANLENDFPDSVQIIFDVHGGFQPDTVVIPTTIDVEMPTRIVTSPIDSQTQLFDMSATLEIPYLFVVDQRRLGRASAGVGATRGQVLRINPRRSTTDTNSLFPIYEDPSLSGNLWPIQ